MLQFKSKKMVLNKKIFLLALLLLINFLLLAKTKSVILNDKNDYSEGKFENTFIDKNNHLALNYPTKKVLDIKEDVIWAIHSSENGNLLISTTPNGKLSLYDSELKLLSSVELGDEITSIYEHQDSFYLGSSLNGIIYKSDLALSKVEEFVKVDLRFIWDIISYKNSLYIAGGGTSGKIIKIDLPSTSVEELVELEEVKNVLKFEFHQNKLYFSTSKQGRLYSYDFNNEAVELYYESKSSEIPDFTLVANKIYLITSGEDNKKKVASNRAAQNFSFNQEKNNLNNNFVPNPESNNLNGNQDSLNQSNSSLDNGKPVASRGVGGFLNSLLEVNERKEVRTLKEIPNSNLTALEFNIDKNQLLMSSFEKSNIWSYDLQADNLELIYEDGEMDLSHLFLKKNSLFFLSANTSQLFQMKLERAKVGYYESRVYSFAAPVYWGRFYYEGVQQNDSTQLQVRVGNSSTPDEQWTDWQSPDDFELKLAAHMQFKITLENGLESSVSKVQFFYNPLAKSPEVKNFRAFSLSKDNLDYNNIKQKIKVEAIKGSIKNRPNGNYVNAFPVRSRNVALIWEIDNPDNLIIQYNLYYQQINHEANSNEAKGEWKVLEEGFYNKDSHLLDVRDFFDGYYIFKLEYNDYLSLGELEGKKGELISPKLKIDNTKPFVAVVEDQSDKLLLTIKDNMSFISGVKYSTDRKAFFDVLPQDKVYDEKEEIFEIGKSSEVFLMFTDNENNINYQIISSGEKND